MCCFLFTPVAGKRKGRDAFWWLADDDLTGDKNKTKSGKRARYFLVDALRGVAIIGVVFYHFAWDLRYLEFITTNVDIEPVWLTFQRSLLASFLLLAGISLALAHDAGMRWPAYAQRLWRLMVTALMVSIATFILFPDSFVYFGVLHAIALFSVMALPFRRVPVWLVFAVAVFFIGLPFFVQSSVFNAREWSWIGFWTVPPLTQDLVPIFPGFGIVLVGLGGMRLGLRFGLGDWLAGFQPSGVLARVLKSAGQKSLLIYLLHQPVLLAVLIPLAGVLQPEVQPSVQPREEAFYGACFGSCIELNGNATQCKAYCQCSLELVAEGNHWETVNAPQSTPAQREVVGAITRLCSAMTK